MTGPRKKKGTPSASALEVPQRASLSAQAPLPAGHRPAHCLGARDCSGTLSTPSVNFVGPRC